MKRKHVISLVAVAALALVSACGGGGGGDTPATSMTISGKLFTGTVDPVSPSKSITAKATPDAPLPNYQLACVTFASTPITGNGTSGADGTFSFTLATSSASFGCFVLDAEGSSVATLVFTDSGNTESGQTVSATGSVDLGTVTVSLRNGVAQAAIPSGVTLVSSETVGADCPEGTWLATGVGRSDPCSEDIEATVWIVKGTSGDYTASFTAYNAGIDGVCSVGSKSGLGVTLTEGVAYFDFLYEFEDPPSPSKVAHLAITPNAACTEAAVHQRVTGCASCPCTGEGDVICESDFTATRQ